MRPSSPSSRNREPRRRSRPSSPAAVRGRSTATLVDSDLVTITDPTSLFEHQQSQDFYSNSNPNPRSFPYSVKQQCWDKAEKIRGRDPDRWRRDALGNIVFRKLVGCPGCLCHDYDHIVPYSKTKLVTVEDGCSSDVLLYPENYCDAVGGKSTLENCQVLQATVNRSKGNRTEMTKAELIQKSSYCRVSGRDMDLLELSAFGNVHREPDSGGCRIQ
ncbi:uncharacterized protein LOC129320580 isoform X1 [Prosopis cineraria]|uniref:uncharacterized protein LOC129320580 isoform X1 n=1 Tax=Prosopis cineraria TaxID=364024 RepID=UPI00241042E6|nr:uncharacterized protein LOC129320580 isoform X1 [Prosopis cineraria]